jgi:2-dehydro-3-deoxyphosphogluconate aldolase / (4S)-4-hydroxy-2-oxoglutarate aldolase
MTRAATQTKLGQSGIIAIIRGDYSHTQLDNITAALERGGVNLLEITLNSTDALKAIQALREAFSGRMAIGAGTIRSLEQAKQALAAGAEFLISPNLNPRVVEFAIEQDLLHLPGVLTPSEVQSALEAGARILKLFPADSLGIGYLKALKAPFDEVQFVPTGGVTPDNIGAFVQAGAYAVALGGGLVQPERSEAELERLAGQCRQAWEQARANF